MATKLSAQQKAHYKLVIQRAGLWNKVFGWIWLANGVLWAVWVGATAQSNNPIAVLASVVNSLATPFLDAAVIVSVVLGLMHLAMGTYMRLLAGPLIKPFLVVCTVAALLFSLALVPIPFAIMSIYGLYAYAKLQKAGSATFKPKKFVPDQFRLEGALIGIVLVVIAVLFISGVSKNASNFSDSDAGGKYFTTGACASKAAQKSCVYTSQIDNFQATYPEAPTVFHNHLSEAESYYPAKHISVSGNGLSVDVFKFHGNAGATEMQETITGVNFECKSNDPTTDVYTPTSFNGLTATRYEVVGKDSILDGDCHFYALAIAKANKVYVLSGEHIVNQHGTNGPSSAEFEAFVASFKFTD